MPTIPDLARRRVGLYTRPGWTEEQYVHADSMLAKREDDTVIGVATCWCMAPIRPTDPEADDAGWVEYTGSVAQMRFQPIAVPAEFFGRDLPPELTALLEKVSGVAPEGEVKIAEQFEVPNWKVTRGMRA